MMFIKWNHFSIEFFLLISVTIIIFNNYSIETSTINDENEVTNNNNNNNKNENNRGKNNDESEQCLSNNDDDSDTNKNQKNSKCSSANKPKRYFFQRDIDANRYIFYDVNFFEGFNLRRDVYIRVACFVKKLKQLLPQFNWFLILPPWPHLRHWRNQNFEQSQLAWSNFFNLTSLNTFINVLEIDQFLKIKNSSTVTIDRVFYLQNFKDIFDIDDATGRQVWKEKYLIDKCQQTTNYNKNKKTNKISGNFWNYKQKFNANKHNCLSFQGTSSFLAKKFVTTDVFDEKKEDVISSIMLDRSEVLLHDNYGDVNYWTCRQSMQFSHKLIQKSLHLIKKFKLKSPAIHKLNSNNSDTFYLSVHLRQQDFLYNKQLVNLQSAAKQILHTMKEQNLTIVYVSTDASFKGKT
jgi:peptide-O-fucosyltransferase